MVALTLGGSFVGGAAIGVVLIGVVLAVIVAFLGLVGLPWGIWLPSWSWPWVDVLVLGGLAGGVTGTVVGLVSTLARWFRAARAT